MTDTQSQQGSQWSDHNPVLGTGEGEVPLATIPSADITMRTAASDVASIKETGGGEPKPYTPAASPSAPELITPPVADLGNVAPMAPMPEAAPAQKKSGGAVGIIIALVVIVILFSVGYFYVYPTFIKAPQSQEVISAESPVATTTPSAPVSEKPATPAVQTPQAPTVVLHASLFKTSADVTSEATMPTPTKEEVVNAFRSQPVQSALLKEVVFKNSDAKVYAFSAIAGILMPDLFTASVSETLESDATFFTYLDQNGTWPGFVVRMKSGADAAKVKTDISLIEKSPNMTSLFVSDPGTPGMWKDGKVNATVGRYVPFSSQGFALNYAWFGNDLVVSTSYAGIKAVAAKLGY